MPAVTGITSPKTGSAKVGGRMAGLPPHDEVHPETPVEDSPAPILAVVLGEEDGVGAAVGEVLERRPFTEKLGVGRVAANGLQRSYCRISGTDEHGNDIFRCKRSPLRRFEDATIHWHLIEIGKQRSVERQACGLRGPIHAAHVRQVSCVHRSEILRGQIDLLEVVGRLHASGGLAHLLNGRQQQADQDRENGDYDQQFDKGKPPRVSPRRESLRNDISLPRSRVGTKMPIRNRKCIGANDSTLQHKRSHPSDKAVDLFNKIEITRTCQSRLIMVPRVLRISGHRQFNRVTRFRVGSRVHSSFPLQGRTRFPIALVCTVGIESEIFDPEHGSLASRGWGIELENRRRSCRSVGPDKLWDPTVESLPNIDRVGSLSHDFDVRASLLWP